MSSSESDPNVDVDPVSLEIKAVESIVRRNLAGPVCYLELLGVTESASPDHIRKAYKEKCLLLHPDKNRNHPGAAEAFRYINQAYNELINPSTSQNMHPLHRTGGINVYQNTTSEQYKNYDKLCQSLLEKLNDDAKNGSESSFSTQCINEYVFQTSTTKVYEPVETKSGTFCRNKRPRLSYAYHSSEVKPNTTTTTQFYYTTQTTPPDPHSNRKRARTNGDIQTNTNISNVDLNVNISPMDAQAQYLLSTFGYNEIFQTQTSTRKREMKASTQNNPSKQSVPSPHTTQYQSIYYSYQVFPKSGVAAKTNTSNPKEQKRAI